MPLPTVGSVWYELDLKRPEVPVAVTVMMMRAEDERVRVAYAADASGSERIRNIVLSGFLRYAFPTLAEWRVAAIANAEIRLRHAHQAVSEAQASVGPASQLVDRLREMPV